MAYPWERERPESPPQPYEAENPWAFTEDEIAALKLIRDSNPEVISEREARDREKAFLEWGKWLVDHGKVSEG